ncbi:MAG: sulfite exporter TauE/SafE family protein [archaeon]
MDLIIVLILIGVVALIMELVDAGLGMGYGTVLTPLMLAFGFASLVIIPAVLLSQAIGGFTAAMFHQKQKNVDFGEAKDLRKIKQQLKSLGYYETFKIGFTKDTKIVLIITVFGVIATVIGAFVAINLPKWALNTYIGILVLVIGILLLSGKTFKFSLKKMLGIGLLASFNKGISGGGFGPVATGGQMIGGNEHKSAIGCTTLSEAPICIAGFLTFLFVNGIQNWWLVLTMSIGAVIGAPLGALLTKKLHPTRFKYILGIIIAVLGAWTIINLII